MMALRGSRVTPRSCRLAYRVSSLYVKAFGVRSELSVAKFAVSESEIPVATRLAKLRGNGRLEAAKFDVVGVMAKV